MEKLILEGKDNDNKPRQLYADRLANMTEEQLFSEVEKKIWLSAYASNNHRSDYHWHCDAGYSECVRRGKLEIYSKAFNKASSR